MAILSAELEATWERPPFLPPLDERDAQASGLVEWFPFTLGSLRDMRTGTTAVRAATPPTWSPGLDIGLSLSHTASTGGVTWTSRSTSYARWTQMAWVVARSLGSYRAVTVTRTSGLEGLMLSSAAGNPILYNVADASGSYARDTGLVLPLNTPILLAATGDGTNVTVYTVINGLLSSFSYAATNTNGASRAWNSGYDSGSGGRWDGLITDVRLYSYAKTPGEIYSHWHPSTRWELYTHRQHVAFSFSPAAPPTQRVRLPLLGVG